MGLKEKESNNLFGQSEEELVRQFAADATTTLASPNYPRKKKTLLLLLAIEHKPLTNLHELSDLCTEKSIREKKT